MFRGTCDAPGDDGAGGGSAHLTGAPPLQAIGELAFIDGTAFNLSNNARMALNEFVAEWNKKT